MACVKITRSYLFVNILCLRHIEKDFDHPVYDIMSDRVVGSVYNEKVIGNKGREK